jgi:hypothetical protein
MKRCPAAATTGNIEPVPFSDRNGAAAGVQVEKRRR